MLKVGDDVTVTSFEPGQQVKVSAVSIGKGFQGTIKRHNFSRGPETHGSHNVRAPGSVGASADPGPRLQGHADAGPDGLAPRDPAGRQRGRGGRRAQPAADPRLRARRQERHGGGAQRWLRPASRRPRQSRARASRRPARQAGEGRPAEGDLQRALPRGARPRGRPRGPERAAPRHPLQPDPRRGGDDHRQGLAPEGHRPRPRRRPERAAPLRRRRRVRPEAPPLHRQGQPQGAPQGAARRPHRARRARTRSPSSTAPPSTSPPPSRPPTPSQKWGARGVRR